MSKVSTQTLRTGAMLPVLAASGFYPDRICQERGSARDGRTKAMASDDHVLKSDPDIRQLFEWSYEYLLLADRQDDLDEDEQDRMREIERSVYTLYEEMDDERRAKTATSIRVFINLVYTYRKDLFPPDTSH